MCFAFTRSRAPLQFIVFAFFYRQFIVFAFYSSLCEKIYAVAPACACPSVAGGLVAVGLPFGLVEARRGLDGPSPSSPPVVIPSFLPIQPPKSLRASTTEPRRRWLAGGGDGAGGGAAAFAAAGVRLDL